MALNRLQFQLCYRALLLLGFLLQGTACALPAALFASGTSSAAATASATATAYPITTAGVATTVTTGKSPSEHALSQLTQKDCSLFHLFTFDKDFCVDIPAVIMIDKSAPYQLR
ncbi:MAG: hypothetical protein NT054_05850 [Burkholderiales bacterium]|nr:hypothetical protein [Burkholderiales bacterium]